MRRKAFVIINLKTLCLPAFGIYEYVVHVKHQRWERGHVG